MSDSADPGGPMPPRDAVFAGLHPTRKPLSMLLNSCTQFLSSFNVVSWLYR
jgi:hypothetical protein